jgi:hypothetical protein
MMRAKLVARACGRVWDWPDRLQLHSGVHVISDDLQSCYNPSNMPASVKGHRTVCGTVIDLRIDFPRCRAKSNFKGL